MYGMKIVGIILAIALMVFLMIYFTIHDSQRIKMLHREYRDVSFAERLDGRVQDLYTIKGACFVILDSQKIFLSAQPSEKYSKRYLSEILVVGDSIIKREFNDSITIHSLDGNEFSFKLNISSQIH